MSVIFGVNLSDRIYIAGDSRISNIHTDTAGTETISVLNDNMLKTEVIINSKGVAVATAGDAKFAKFIPKKLYNQDFVREGVLSVRSSIEDWIKPVAEEYFQNGYTQATFIFGGADTASNKVVNGQDVMKLVTAYTGGQGSGTLKKVLADAITSKGDGIPNPTPELSIPNTMLFSVMVSRSGVHIEDTNWGQYLIYGPKGLVKDDVPMGTIGQLEFGHGASQPDHDIGLITLLIHDLAESKQLDTVGGCVVVLMPFHDGTVYLMDGDIKTINKDTGEVRTMNRFKVLGNVFYRLDEHGTRYKLTPVSKYTSSGSAHLLI